MKPSKILYRDGISFFAWMESVDEILIQKLGVSSEDLPDFLWADLYDSRFTARMAVEEYLSNQGE